MPSDRVLLIANPAARSTRQRSAAVECACAAQAVACETAWTTAPGHAAELAGAARADGWYRAIFVLGGDGTVMEAVTGVATNASAAPIGILPCGTANILARTLGIPIDPVRAVRSLLTGSTTVLDLGRLNDGRRFLIGAGVGLDAAMIASASASLKQRIGWGAYVFGAALAGLRFRKFSAAITADGARHELTASSILVANVGTAAKRFHFGGPVRPDDGVLNVCVYAPRTRFDAVRLFWRMLRGQLDCDRCFSCFSGRNIRIETDPPLSAQADGELLNDTPLEITVEPAAARMLVPAQLAAA